MPRLDVGNAARLAFEMETQRQGVEGVEKTSRATRRTARLGHPGKEDFPQFGKQRREKRSP